jgi:hypothetical protein
MTRTVKLTPQDKKRARAVASKIASSRLEPSAREWIVTVGADKIATALEEQRKRFADILCAHCRANVPIHYGPQGGFRHTADNGRALWCAAARIWRADR